MSAKKFVVDAKEEKNWVVVAKSAKSWVVDAKEEKNLVAVELSKNVFVP